MSLVLVDALPLISVHVTPTVLLWMLKDVYHASVKVLKIQINLASEENFSLTTLVYSCAYFQSQRLFQVVSQRLQLSRQFRALEGVLPLISVLVTPAVW